METVWKFALVTGPYLNVMLPDNAKPLSAKIQRPPYGDNHVQIWVQLDRSLMDRREKLIKYEFFAFQTGQALPNVGLRFLSTCEDPKIGLIWHVFWRKEEK